MSKDIPVGFFNGGAEKTAVFQNSKIEIIV
jgi:hypothetical protein